MTTVTDKTFIRNNGWCYHGDFKTASEAKNGLWIMLTGSIVAGKEGKKPYVPFMLDGEREKYKFVLENETVIDQVRGLQLQKWYHVTAVGGRETACLGITDADGVVVNSSPSTPSSPQQAPSVRGYQEVVSEPVHSRTPPSPRDVYIPKSLGGTVWTMLQLSYDLNEAFEEKYGRPMTEHERAIAIGLTIEAFRGTNLPLLGAKPEDDNLEDSGG